MRYYSRKEVESIGKAGAYSYDDVIDGKSIIVSRQLASYWLATLPDDKGLSVHFKEDGFWEAWITLWISRNVSPNAVCIDAGANYGYFTFQLAAHGCEVYAIEANPALIPFLLKSVELNGFADRVHVVNAAVSDTDGKKVRLHITESSGNSSINTYTHTNDLILREVDVETIALSRYSGITPIDFIKMDIEGAEELAFDGLGRLLRMNPKCVILLELVYELYPERAKLFYNKISESCVVSYVDYDGNEQPVKDYSFIENDTEAFRMFVVRSK